MPTSGRPAVVLLCLLSILLMGPTITAFAYAAHQQPANAPSVASHQSHAPELNVSLPALVRPIVPSGFTPSSNPIRVLPVISNGTSRVGTALGSNDGYCFYGTNQCGQLTYHGGPVMHNALIVLVLWAGCGSNGCLSCSTGYFDNATIDPKASNPNDCTYGSLQYDYFKDFCASGNPLLTIINQYTDRNGGLGSCSVYGGKWYYDPTPFPERPLSDSDIQTEAIGWLNSMNISANTNTAVFVFTPYGVSSCIAGNNCFPTGGFCAYHSWFWSGASYLSPQVIYTNMPDVGWAGAGCGLGGPSPNHDPFADAEVSPLSHEADESFTDPTPGDIYGDGWYYGGFLEIGDECAYDFVGTQSSDGSNVHLGAAGTVGHPYRIQSEWSNSNGGCTLDLSGPPTLVQEAVYQDISTGTPASPQVFPISYQEAGETGVFSTTNSTCCGPTPGFFVTQKSHFTTDPVVGLDERWCFEASCRNQTLYVGGPIFLAFYYYDLLHQATSYKVTGGGSVPPPVLSYETAPSVAGQGDSPAARTMALGASSQEIWPLRGSAVTVPGLLASSSPERWITQQSSWVATAADVVPPTIVYYHQYSLTLSYSVVDGGSPAAPLLTFQQLGSIQYLYLGTTPATYWLDGGTTYSVTNPLPGSNSTDRWISKLASASGTANHSAAMSFVYYHQFYLGVSYSVLDGGTPQAPTLQIETMGTHSPYTMTQTTSFFWIDANTWSAPATLANSTPTERWAAKGEANGTVGSSSPIALVYYHQLRFILGYSTSDGSAAEAPTFSFVSFGRSFSSALHTSAEPYWLDSGAAWSTNHLLNGSSSLERWVTNYPTIGVASAPLTAALDYLHEYFVTIQTVQKSAGSVPATGWYNATVLLSLTAQANNGWQFERWDGIGTAAYSGTTNGTPITIQSPIFENATFYPGLTLTYGGAGQIAYQWGANRGSLASGATIYVPVGTNVTLRAAPASYFFTFSGYNGAVSSVKATSSIVVDGPTNVSASFSLNYILLAALFGGIGLGGGGLVYYLRRPRRG